MKRRTFLTRSASAAAGFVLTLPGLSRVRAGETTKRFSLGFAPHPDMFKNLAGPNVIDQIKFAADQGFTAWEDNGMPGRPAAEQEKIGQTLANLRMQMGLFVAYASFDEPTFAVPNPAKQEEILGRIREAVVIAKRCGAKCCTVVPGSVDQQSNKVKDWNMYGGPRLSEGYQTANVIELLRRCAAILEPHGLAMVLEPLNWHRDHGGVFLQQSDQAYAVCRAVKSPACKILFDVYHQQITEGNLIPNIDRCWDEIGYFQCGDNPGRKEPGTGELNYRNIFKAISETGYKDFVALECGHSTKNYEDTLKATLECLNWT